MDVFYSDLPSQSSSARAFMLTSPPSSTQRSLLRRLAPVLILLGLVGVGIFFIATLRSQPDLTAVSVARLERLGKALFKYAEHHQGALPRHLRELSPQDFETLEASNGGGGFIDPESEREFEWLYLPQVNLQKLAPETILVASPSAIAHQNDEQVHLVWRRDGLVSYVPEEQFLRTVEKQLQGGGK
jgi:hypothetical protein